MLSLNNAQFETICIETPPVSFICPFRRRQVSLKKAELHNSAGMFFGILKQFQKITRLLGKIDKFENLNSSIYSRILNSSFNTHSTFWQQFTGKNVEKTFLFFCIPTNQERAQSTHMLQQCLEYCPLSTTNQQFFIRIIYTITYQRLYTKKGPRSRKKNFFLEFFREFQRVLGDNTHGYKNYSRKFFHYYCFFFFFIE